MPLEKSMLMLLCVCVFFSMRIFYFELTPALFPTGSFFSHGMSKILLSAEQRSMKNNSSGYHECCGLFSDAINILFGDVSEIHQKHY